MSDRMALKIAIELLHVPSQLRLLRSKPLPDGMLLLLRIVAGDAEAEQTAAELVGRPRETVRRAATFFIEQVLFAPDADSYRVLGATPQASADELKCNLALLMRWLHPDLDPQGRRSIFVDRVTTAWNTLKTPERRAEYNILWRPPREKRKSGKSNRRNVAKRVGGVLPERPGRGWCWPVQTSDKIGFLRRSLSILFRKPPRATP